MTVAFPVIQLRRYPVKSMGGENMGAADLDVRGLVGDRWFAVRDEEGHFASGKDTRRFRRRDQVFEYAAATLSGQVCVSHQDGLSWLVGDPALDAHVSARIRCPVSVSPEGDVPHQDMGSVSLIGTATLRWCAQRWGVEADPRRLRVNLVIDTSEPFIEESWVGREAKVGTAILKFDQCVPRCRMIDIDQDGATATGRWLKPLAAERNMKLAVYADVVRPGRLELGDLLHLVQSSEGTRAVGCERPGPQA